MAAFMFMEECDEQQAQTLRSNRVFRDRTHPFEEYDDDSIFRKFRFNREAIVKLTDLVSDDLQFANRQGSLTPLL